VLVIDYIQLMTGSGKSSENRVQEITEITTGLKALAKELNVPIIALSQLSRQVESRDDKRPQLSDLRESGSIEQDADVVLFVFREEYYVKNKEPRPSSIRNIEEWEDEFER
jgi:replicative DNA helicase